MAFNLLFRVYLSVESVTWVSRCSSSDAGTQYGYSFPSGLHAANVVLDDDRMCDEQFTTHQKWNVLSETKERSAIQFQRSTNFRAHTTKPHPSASVTTPVADVACPKVQSTEGHVAGQQQEQPGVQQTRPSRATHKVNPSGLQGLVDPSMETNTSNLHQNSPVSWGTVRQGFLERAKKKNKARDGRKDTRNKDSPYVWAKNSEDGMNQINI